MIKKSTMKTKTENTQQEKNTPNSPKVDRITGFENYENEEGKMAIYLPKREFYDAKITSGTYNTKGYYSKTYKTAAGLKKGLVAHNFKTGEAYNGMTWNHYATQYKLTFDFN